MLLFSVPLQPFPVIEPLATQLAAKVFEGVNAGSPQPGPKTLLGDVLHEAGVPEALGGLHRKKEGTM